MFLSMDSPKFHSVGTPRWASAWAVNFIMISGPQTNAVVFGALKPGVRDSSP